VHGGAVLSSNVPDAPRFEGKRTLEEPANRRPGRPARQARNRDRGLSRDNYLGVAPDLTPSARQVIVLVDSTKWGTVGLADVGPLAAVDVVITDDAMPADARATVTDAVDELILVAPDAYGGT
jgi:hypothetical protein